MEVRRNGCDASRRNDHYHFVTCLQCLKCGLLSGAIVAYREYRV